jgi:hypothetical protein
MTLLLILLITVGPFLAAIPGLLAAALEAPEFFTGRRPRYSRVAPRRWQAA